MKRLDISLEAHHARLIADLLAEDALERFEDTERKLPATMKALRYLRVQLTKALR